MVSVMNGNDFTCKPDAIEAVAVNSSENTTLSEDTKVSGAKSVNVIGSEEVRVSVGGLRSMENGRCEEARVEEEMKDGDGYMVGGKKSIEVEMRTVNGGRFSARDGETEQWNGRGRVSESGVGKGHIEVGKPCVSEYDAMISMFDEYAASDKGKGKAVGPARDSGSVGYDIGDMVWGKVKSHPWWPGHVYNEAFATPSVRRSKREGHVLVAFFGDSSYGWFELTELLPFDSNYTEKSRQTNMRTFVRAVEEAVDEASRRCALALACHCRNPYNFRPAEDQGYFAVDLGDSEPAGVYSMTQIRKSRESFQPRDVIAFAKQLALTHGGDGHGSIEIIKNKATIMAYRKAVFEEFDETYAQAFGKQPERPSREPMRAVTQTARAPLSGPLVFAEALGKKNSRKQSKAKDQLDTDRYLFKPRDEPNEFKIRQKGLKTTSLRPSLVEGSPELASGVYELQKRASALSPKQQIPAKVEQMFATEINSPSTTSRVTSMEDEPVAPRFNVPGLPVSGSKVEQRPDAGDNYPVRPNLDHMSPLLEPNSSKSVDGFQRPPNFAAKVEQTNGIGVKFQGQDSRLRMETGVKKTKLVKCPAGESVAEKSSLGVKKKKREKELVMEMRMQKKAFTGNADPPSREDIRLEHQKKDHGGSSLFCDSLGSLPATIGLGKLELKLPQLLDGLHALALNPFCGMESNNSAIRRAFVNFRSLVYQKSLPMSSKSEMQSHEVPPPENAKDLPSAKLQKSLMRPSDPTKGGRKRVPSDRLDELSAKRVKKINDIKSLAVEKKVGERNLESQRDAKETMDSRRAKWFRPDPVKKKEPLAKVREPTILVMKFPPNTTLPAGFELKARLARFGPLDDSRTRILWKSSQVHVVFFHRADAEAAHRHLVGSNTLFGKVSMRCSIRPLEATAPESETKVQREDGSVETPYLRDSRAEQRPASATKLKSCLKKQVVDEAAALADGVGGRGTSRVKFVLGVAEGGGGGGEEIISSYNHISSNELAAMSATGGSRLLPRVNFMSGGGENLMDASKNILNTASLADGASSISHGMDFSSKNFQKGNLPPLLPLPQFQNAATNLRYMETTHRTTHSFDARLSSNFDEATHRTTHDYDAVPRSNSVDIAPEMLSLLAKCYDVVTNLVCNQGYLPYHPL